MTDGHQVQQRPLRAAVESRERPVLPTGALRRTSRLAMLPLGHAARTAAVASRLSRAATDQVAARTAEQLFATLGELKGGAAKLGQAMSVFEAAMPAEVAAPYRSALRRLTDAAPTMPAEVARRVVAADLAAAYGPGWRDRLVAFDDIPAAAASIGQVHRGQWRIDGGQVVQVAVKAPLSALLDGRTDLLPEGWRELDDRGAADLAARLLGHAIYAPSACTGWMHADLHPGNFLLLPGGRLGMLDFGAVAATPGGIPAPFGQLAAAVLDGDGPTAIRLARQAGALPLGAEVDPRLIIELLHPLAATGADTTFTYSRPWLRGLMAHLTQPRFAPALRNLTPPPEYALVWRATLAAAALFAQLGATVPTRGFHLAYSPGFRGSIPPARPQRTDGALRHAS